MPAIASPSLDVETSTAESLLKLIRRGASQIPTPASSIALLTVFALISASLGLLGVWYFVRRGGFVWKEGDWEDYVSSVMRRPGNPDSDILTVFSDGSCRRGGAGSRGTRTIVLSEYEGMSRAERSVISGVSRSGIGGWKGFLARLRGGDWESEMNESEYERRLGGGARRQKEAKRAAFFDQQTEYDARSIATQEPARVPGWKPEDAFPEKSELNRSRTTKSYYPGDDREHQHYSTHGHSYHQERKPKEQTLRPVASMSSLSSSSSDSSDSYITDSEDDEEEYGTKVYTHKLEKRPALDLWEDSTPGSSGQAYRSTRKGSLSTMGSVEKSNAGRR